MVQDRRDGDEFVVDDGSRRLARTRRRRRRPADRVRADGLGYYDDGEEHLFDVDESLEARRAREAKRNAGALSMEALERNRRLDAQKKGEVKKVSSLFLGKGAATVGPGSMKEKASDMADGAWHAAPLHPVAHPSPAARRHRPQTASWRARWAIWTRRTRWRRRPPPSAAAPPSAARPGRAPPAPAPAAARATCASCRTLRSSRATPSPRPRRRPSSTRPAPPSTTTPSTGRARTRWPATTHRWAARCRRLRPWPSSRAPPPPPRPAPGRRPRPPSSPARPARPSRRSRRASLRRSPRSAACSRPAPWLRRPPPPLRRPRLLRPGRTWARRRRAACTRRCRARARR